MYHKVKEIEHNYDVENIRYKGSYVWAYLRLSYYWKSIEEITCKSENKKKTFFIINWIQYFKKAFYGFFNWFHSYEYLFFSDTQERISFKNNYVDKSFEEIINNLGNEKCLCIDTPNPEHLSIDKIKNNIVSHAMLKIIISISSKLSSIFNKVSINIKLLDTICTNENLYVDYALLIKRFDITVKCYTLLFKIYKPKAIFISCYYCNQAIIKAANDLNIETIEMQHGNIGDSHTAYNFYCNADKSFYPSTLLTYGEYDKNILSKSQYTPFENIVPVGNYNLELIEEQNISSELLALVSAYKTVVSISTQYIVEEKMAKFMKQVAIENEDTVFLFSLRHFSKSFYKQFDMPKNVFLFKGEYSCYEILRVSSIHMTCSSTCATEAFFFRKKIILVDIDELAIKSSFGSMNTSNISIIRDVEEFVKLDKKYQDVENNFYVYEYSKRIESWVKGLENKND